MSDMEREVREMLQSKSNRAPTMEEPPRPVLRRARARKATNSIGLAAIVAVLATGAFVGVRSLGTTTTIVPDVPAGGVPWKAIPADPPGTQICTAADLEFSVDAGADSALRFRPKRSDISCSLTSLDVVMMDANGKQLNAFVRKAPTFAGLVVENSRALTLARFAWMNGCAPTTGPIRFLADIGRQGGYELSALATNAGESPCTGSRSNTGLTINAVGSISLFEGAPMSELEAEISGTPKLIRRGEVIRYVVTLTNPTDRPIALDPCPRTGQTFTAGVQTRDVSVNRLNCAAAPEVIPPRHSLPFQMEVKIPADAAGEVILRWAMNDRDTPQVTIALATLNVR